MAGRRACRFSPFPVPILWRCSSASAHQRARPVRPGEEKPPSIVFIDEIDAVGRHARPGRRPHEREQTLNQLLVEMDGRQQQGVIIIAATNRRDILDPALLRPGRFDRQVGGYPDIKGREAILKVTRAARGRNCQTIAKTTGGFTGADLENL